MQRFDQQSHDRMVRHVAQWFTRQGASNVCADLAGYDNPMRIIWTNTNEGHVPDVTADLGGKAYLVEVETADTIEDEHTESQWRLFAAFAQQHNKIFVVVVPMASKAAAEIQLRRLGLTGEVWGL